MESTPSPAPLALRAWSTPARVGAVVLQAIAVLNVLYVAAHLVYDILEGTETAPPRTVALGLTLFSGVPLLLVGALRHLGRATLEVLPETLALVRGGTRFEIPLTSIKTVQPWRLPFPGGGVSLRMSSGRTFRHHLEASKPSALLAALTSVLPVEAAPPRSGALAYVTARSQLGRRGWVFLGIKHGLAPLVLTVITFRLHQMIVFGSPFGQYRLFGLASYLKTFADFWMGTAGGLLVYASVWRVLTEALALPITVAVPRWASGIRRGVEGICFVAYFVLVPGFVLFRLLL
ncbi:hypothetical protein [Chondromyces crocatus]|uniref:Uncharacterized protein n=1 Tax=Chondromyces crocatus TaxID=52 RepID=A0A0K1ESQ1_CHOCO|nr:hypothetical protein [Chondromyces crocatus]AKT43638.1 uncharacterized protein CMC5_078730 [Chondromyces crocatus]